MPRKNQSPRKAREKARPSKERPAAQEKKVRRSGRRPKA